MNMFQSLWCNAQTRPPEKSDREAQTCRFEWLEVSKNKIQRNQHKFKTRQKKMSLRIFFDLLKAFL